MFRKSVLVVLVTVSISTLSCGGGDSGTPSTAADTGTTPTDTGGGTTTFKAVNTCTTEAMFIDATGDASKAKVTPWDETLGNKGCIKIKKGMAVTWSPTPSATHPLEAFGGDSGNPITLAASVTFPGEGTFGFRCGIHTTTMQGAVWVVP
jgi:plastocyanin